MSPRAACRLENLGFERVYDYTAGIADWKAAGLPVEGPPRPHAVVADATRPDLPAHGPEEQVGAARERTFAAGWDEAVVVDCDRVVVGRLRGPAWEADPGEPVGSVMEAGPTTVRPDGLLQPLVERMEKRNTRLVVVTTPQGRLIGALFAAEAGRLLGGEPPERIWADCDGCPGRWQVAAEG